MIPRERIRDDLRGVFRGRLAFDAPTRAVYAADAGPFEIVPHGVAAPLDTADLAVLVEYAHENALPLVPRGAGTSPAGAAIGPGLVVDLSVHFRSVIDTGPDWVRVQAGVTAEELAAALAAHGRRFPVESPTTAARTLGGMVATDAAGPNAARAGYCRDHVRAVGVVFDSGEVATVLAAGVTPESVGLPVPERGPRFIELRAQTAAILAEHRELIQLTSPRLCRTASAAGCAATNPGLTALSAIFIRHPS